MRALYVCLSGVLCVLFVSSCSKSSVKSYSCECKLEDEEDKAVSFQEYGVHAPTKLDADNECSDIERRVESDNTEKSVLQNVQCTIK